MRSYPRNSPEAASRIVALVLIADGHVCRSEIEALSESTLERELGLAPGNFGQVVQDLCEDLLMGAYAGESLLASVDDGTLAAMMREVDAPDLQHSVLRLTAAAAAADRHLAEAELLVIAAARRQWELPDDALASRDAVAPAWRRAA
jgi:hypothetical protein